VGLGRFTFSLWNLDRQIVPEPVRESDLRVGVLIPTYNEPREVLFPTVAAAVALDPGHETYVLDDGQRLWVRAMAASLGARYIARDEHPHAKASNVNHALAQLDLDVVAILDADHIPDEEFLANTLGYFADPRVAVVQTPQDFYNLDSFEHDKNRSWLSRGRRAISFNEQPLFYRAIQPGKNRWKAAFWCGTNALVRVSAIEEIGGIADETVTEDMHTTIRLHRSGWESIYHNEVLAQGLAARDATEYQAQRLRWGTGAMQILRLEHPFTRRGLSLSQRLAYASTILGWFDAWRTLGYLLLPLVVLSVA
jgi:cellulose synthase/poly-beta-1,6-N-acetylglucosamine synthase-like glycosyltransferase